MPGNVSSEEDGSQYQTDLVEPGNNNNNDSELAAEAEDEDFLAAEGDARKMKQILATEVCCEQIY